MQLMLLAVTGAVCPQNFAVLNFMPVPVPVPQLVSEDCLFLNIWTPTMDKNANLPVMLFIHGGSFISGTLFLAVDFEKNLISDHAGNRTNEYLPCHVNGYCCLVRLCIALQQIGSTPTTLKFCLFQNIAVCRSMQHNWYASRSCRHCNHTSHGSVSVVRTTFKVYEKMQTLTLSQPKTPEPIVTKFEWRDYVVDAYHQKIGLNPPRGFCSPYKWNIHPSCSKFTSLFCFWFLNSPTGESVGPIFMLNTSNNAVLHKEVPF